MSRVDAGEMRAEAGGDHLVGEFGGGEAEVRAPDGEDGFETGSGELGDAVGADVLEEEVAEGDAVEAFGDGARADLGHARLVVSVGAREGKIDLPERQADGGGLQIEEFFAKAVDGDAAELLVEGGEEGDDLVLGVLAQEVEGPGAVLSSAPTEEDAFESGLWLAGLSLLLRGYSPGGVGGLKSHGFMHMPKVPPVNIRFYATYCKNNIPLGLSRKQQNLTHSRAGNG